ncbi:energy-coupling factor ABC transporter ATP-binding protein [Dialister sp.]|uniref:energy-coupling factor ABC transporter ATP-binding protein n=1 Tax=Dialister sp. TaxID=1955814 RepID=UPI002E801E24|nr:ABC transporter ATP-binding protein [Dialister sp.]MEE3452332.1 ABC transporter ATP-binding protein [Dialister sp.]
MLEMKDISFRYAKNTPIILDHVNLSFDKGEFVAVTGRNGSGKTTITRILTGLEKPESGKVLFNGKDVTKEDAARCSRFIGYVFQQPDRQMFMPTVREEIAFGPFHQGKRGEELEEAITKAMEDTDTTAMADEYPRTLSRGDQQRVAIASALAMNTEYLVLDEPTSGQDGREKKRLVALMESLQKKGITIILVTHDMDIVARDCTRVIVIANKQVAFDDTPDILFSDANRPEDWGLAYPPAVLLGRRLPGAPYCRDMNAFCKEFLKRKGGASR